MAWNGSSLTTPFPPSLAYMQNRVERVTPIWSPGLCAPGTRLDLEGRKVVKTEVPDAHRCVSSEEGYANGGKYMFAFAIEDGKACSYIMFGVRTKEMLYTTESTYPGHTSQGWAYYAANGCAYHNAASTPYAERADSRDVIGMLLDLDVHTLSFLKNGQLLGIAHTLPPGKCYFPCVALYEHGHSVVNLGIE